MTRTTLIATAAFFALSGQCFAGETVKFDRSQLDDPGYVVQLREKIKLAAKKECRSIYRGDWLAEYRIRGCVRDSVAHAMAQLDEAKQTRVAAAKS